MKNISILILALFSSLAQSAFNIPINIPGNINVGRSIETYKNQICNQTCTDGVLKMSFMLTGETSGEKKCPAQALPADLTLSCGAYLCADGKNCAVACDDKCAQGFTCVNRKCVPEKPIEYFCGDDRTIKSSRGESWDCSPLVCQAGRCKERCATTNDCIPGSVCDTSNGSCVYVR